MAAQIITLSNQKGGSAKTTTAHALGTGLIARGYKVLFIDLDSQWNLSYAAGADSKGRSSLDVLTGSATAAEAIQHTKTGDIIPASPYLSGADSMLTEIGKEYRLKEGIESIRDDYDFIVIDTAPSLSVVTVNALTASNKLIIPSGADIFSLHGIRGLYSTIDSIRKYCNPSLRIDGILLTKHNPRARIRRDLADYANQIAAALGTKVYRTVIRNCISIEEAQTRQESIFDYAPRSNAAADYNAFISEFLEERN
jgi:chromosome partitioning protein